MRRRVFLGGIGGALGVGMLILPLTAGADPSPGDSAGLNTAPLTPAVPGKNIQSIPVPGTFTPAQVSSPIDKFTAGLQQDYPDTFGGLTVDAGGNYVVLEVGSNATFESVAQNRFDAIPQAMNVSVPPTSLQLSFKSVANSLAQLDATRQRILSQSMSQPSEVWGVGIDETNNRVLISSSAPSESGNTISTAPSDALEQTMVATYGAKSLEFQHGAMPTTTANRYADSPPWNGGDQLLLPTLAGTNGCTSGPGVHVTSSGGHALLTAGHCTWMYGTNYVGNITAYNTWAGGPVYNSSTDVGLVAISATGGSTMAGAWLDTGLIPTASSNITWTALYNRTYMTGSATPPGGGTVCSEGSFGGEICGQIVALNQTVEVGGPFPSGHEWVSNLDELNRSTVEGDSGGTVYENSVFGPLVTGTNVAANSALNISFSQDITATLYVYSAYYGSPVLVNTISNP